MALPNFIDRAATAASQVLAGFNLTSFKAKLEQQTVALVLDGAATRSREARWTAELTVNLLARLYPTLAIVALDDTAAPLAKALGALALSINPEVTLVDQLDDAVAALIVGETPVLSPAARFYLGSDRWRARLSATAPAGSGASDNPFGAGAAAAFGAANVFRVIFGDQLEAGAPDTAIDLSLFDYTSGTQAGGPELGEVDLGEAHLVGLGAIGNASLWVLARLQGLHGVLHLIDHDPIELSNLQRYVLTTQANVGHPKTDIAAAALAQTNLVTKTYPMRWADYVEAQEDWTFERVAVALDNAPDRIAVQGALPKSIVNAWTQEVDLGVSRHGFADGGPCLCCLYLPMEKTRGEHEVIAEALRLPHLADLIKRLLQTAAPVEPAFVQDVAAAFGVPFDELAPFVGQSVRSFHQQAICGGLMLRLTGSLATGAVVVPMAFQSALAGLMLAAELIKQAAGQQTAPTAITRVNLLRPLAPYLHDPRAPDQTGRCICQDDEFRAAYDAKYPRATEGGPTCGFS